MDSRFVKLCTLVIILSGIEGCAILQRNSPEEKAREFMIAFQERLATPDDEVLKFFETDQSAESLLAAINLLQHEDSDLVECVPDFSNMQLEVESQDESTSNFLNPASNRVKVTVPVTIKAREGDASINVDLIFRLREKNSQFIIYQLEGDNFYNAFTSMKHDIQYAQHQNEELKSREAIYAIADSLSEKFEHIVWYAQYKGEVYFYVVSGDWNEEALYSSSSPRPNFKMGLVNSQGKEIIPIEFDMVGTIGAELDNAIEVTSPEGYGYFSLEGDTLVPSLYRQIIPYQSDPDFWIVETDNGFGWVDENKNFKEGFPSAQTEKNFRQFSYLPSGITIAEGQYALCESVKQESAGSGLFISPSYWVEAGLIEPLKFGITTTITDAPIGGWTEYIELGETLFQSLSENMSVVIASFKERYLEGREEFYEHKKVLFMDSLQNTVLAQDFSRGNLDIKKISEEIIEVTMAGSLYEMYYPGLPLNSELQGRNTYRYCQLNDYSVSELTSSRSYPETEFAKLDDSYIDGAFKLYNDSLTYWEDYNTYPVSILKLMRNEILASYGVAFEDPVIQEYFKGYSWYSPRFNGEAEIAETLTEIDRHNLKFLANAIAQAESI